MNTGSALYYAKMKTLAEQHRLLQHSENELHYFRGELEEFYVGLRNKVNFPAMVVEGYELNYSEDKKQLETSFFIAQDYKEQNDYDEIDRAFDLCERIGESVAKRLMAEADDLNCQSVVLDNAVQMQHETEKYVGMRFNFTVIYPFCDSVGGDDWNDLVVNG